MSWLHLSEHPEPLIVSIPHVGTELPEGMEAGYVSPWLARKDTDWHIGDLYDFAFNRGLENEPTEHSINNASIVHFSRLPSCIATSISRSIIDVNRDPSGQSLYPGMATTELCPTTTFDGEPLYKLGMEPDAAEINRRRELYFDTYHAAIDHLVKRACERYRRVVVFDCHSIRSVIPRLFDGELAHFNIGTNDGKSCDPRLTAAIEACIPKQYSQVTNGRFKRWVHYTTLRQTGMGRACRANGTGDAWLPARTSRTGG